MKSKARWSGGWLLHSLYITAALEKTSARLRNSGQAAHAKLRIVSLILGKFLGVATTNCKQNEGQKRAGPGIIDPA